MALMFSFIDSKAKSRFDIKDISKSKNTPLYAIDKKTHTLASGTEGTIRVAKNLNTNNFCLVKIKSSYNISELFSDSQREYELAKEYSDTYMLDYQAVQSNKQGKAYLFMNEILGQTIGEFNTEGLSAIECLHIIHNLLLELAVLGQKNISHNDINDSNILIDDKLKVYLIDFGRSTKNTMNGLVYGYDFDAICEIIIDDLNLIRHNPELERLLNTKLDSAKDSTGKFNYIDINDLILDVKNKILNLTNQQPSCKKRNQTESFSYSRLTIDDINSPPTKRTRHTIQTNFRGT